MGRIKEPPPVKLVCPALAPDARWFERAEAVLQKRFGPIELTSETWDFDFTDYYRTEMGSGLKRRIYSFRKLIDPGELARIKTLTNKQERDLTEKHRGGPGRAVNLDPGYVCESKLVLASTKDFSHRIYLNNGIFAEITLQWKNNGFVPLETTFPDYRTPGYRFFFELVRAMYREQKAE